MPTMTDSAAVVAKRLDPTQWQTRIESTAYTNFFSRVRLIFETNTDPAALSLMGADNEASSEESFVADTMAVMGQALSVHDLVLLMKAMLALVVEDRTEVNDTLYLDEVFLALNQLR